MFLTPAYSVGVFFCCKSYGKYTKLLSIKGVFVRFFPLPQDCIEYFVGADWFSGGDVYCVEV